MRVIVLSPGDIFEISCEFENLNPKKVTSEVKQNHASLCSLRLVLKSETTNSTD